MSAWALIQVIIDIFAALGFFVIIMRMSRAPKDDPRMSRGLQLLQSKISVLEDLSDRTEQQVSQLTAILDQKTKEVQAKVQLADQHVHEIRVSMERSLEVAKIFQDKIPHEEIIERQNTLKYVQAARLAHQGAGADEIAQKVDLPKGEIEFIAKVNREQLMFNEESLPEWAKAEPGAPAPTAEPTLQPPAPVDDQAERLKMEIALAERQRLVENLSRLQFEMQNLDQQLAREAVVKNFSGAFEVPRVETGPLQKLGDEFRKACEEADQENSRPSAFPPLEQLSSLIPQFFQEDAKQSIPSFAIPQAPQPFAADKVPDRRMDMPQEEMPAPKPMDPAQIRALAQAKVQAALARAKPQTSISAANIQNPDLAEARKLAKDAASGEASSANVKVIRRVQFPKLET